MIYENFVVGASCFIPLSEPDKDFEALKNLNRFIIDLLARKGFSPNETSSWEVQYRNPTLSMTFSPIAYNTKPSIPDKAKSILRLKSGAELSLENYHKLLKRSRDEYPAKILCVFELTDQLGKIWAFRER